MKCKKSVYSKLAFNAEDNSGILQVVAQMKSSEEPILEVSAGKMKISCGKLFKMSVFASLYFSFLLHIFYS